jgi:hypothetical protein
MTGIEIINFMFFHILVKVLIQPLVVFNRVLRLCLL